MKILGKSEADPGCNRLSQKVSICNTFSAVIHYDLPWNPNRMEQREGRVDRFGQSAPKVSAVVMYGKDNHVDKAVLEVLIRKARTIRTLLELRSCSDSAENLVDAMVRKSSIPIYKSLLPISLMLLPKMEHLSLLLKGS